MIFLLRCLRLLRFMAKLPRVHDVVFAINQILPMLATYVGLILVNPTTIASLVYFFLNYPCFSLLGLPFFDSSALFSESSFL